MQKTDFRNSFVVEIHWFLKVFFFLLWIGCWYIFLPMILNKKTHEIMDHTDRLYSNYFVRYFFNFIVGNIANFIVIVFPLILVIMASRKIKVNHNAIEIHKCFGLLKQKFYRKQLYSSQYISQPKFHYIKIRFCDGTRVKINSDEINFMALKEYLNL
jgi:hypothetical protein